MIAKVNKISFFKGIFINFGLFSGLLQSNGLPEKNFERIKENNRELSDIYSVIDIKKTGFETLLFPQKTNFDINTNGDILYKDTTPPSKMYDNATEANVIEKFSFAPIPKFYFKDIDINSLEVFSKRFKIKDKINFTPVILDKIINLEGQCEGLTCSFSDNKLQKDAIVAVGEEKEDSNGVLTQNNSTVNANTITAIGGNGENATGLKNVNGFVNANRITAIGGLGTDSHGFYNESEVNARNLIAIGGQDGGYGFMNRQMLKVNSITAIGGAQKDSFGISNAKEIKTNLLVAIGGDFASAVGVYNQNKIQADMIIASITKNKNGIGIMNAGQIDTNTLVLVGGSKSRALYNYYNGIVNAKNIYLQGYNALYNRGTISTDHLIINDFSSIRGNLKITDSGASSIIFNIANKKWNTSRAYLFINQGNLILPQNTSISVVFSNDKILQNNLSYDTVYKLLEIKDGNLTDNRVDKNIEFKGLSLKPAVKINDMEILFGFNKNPNENIFDSKTADLLNQKLSSLGIKSTEEQNKIIQKISSLSTNATKIVSSIVQGNLRGEDFQSIAVDEGLKTFESNPALLQGLIEQVDETFQENTTSANNFSQKNIEYVNMQVINRINTLSFEKISKPKFSELMRKNALASNDEKIIIPDIKDKNSSWINIGTSYYRNTSASPISSTTNSLNITFGYDRRLDFGNDSDIVLGALFNYAKSFYTQGGEKENFDAYALGAYSNYISGNNEIEGIVSGTWLIGKDKITNEKIGLHTQYYANNNTAFNANIFYKYKISINENHSIKPLILGNYSLLYTPQSSSKNFIFKDSLDFVFALGAGGEYKMQTSKMGHIIQFSGRYHLQDIQKSRYISFKNSDIFVNYDLNPSRTWIRLSYSAKIYLTSALSMDISLIGDMSLKYDLLGMGNAGLNYNW